MLGVYDYTVILTYMSVLSAGLGICVSLNGNGHPYMGVFFLLFCGLCDAFDGKVARSKKDRTEFGQKFGIQIDSLSDLLAFGALPACIGNAMIRVNPKIEEVPKIKLHHGFIPWHAALIFWIIILLYILAALIRLAYFNVAEEERQKTEKTVRKTYEGLPVTSSALIFPNVLLIQFITKWDVTIPYFVVMVIVGILFLSKIKIPKPGSKGLMALISIGALEFIALLFAKLYS